MPNCGGADQVNAWRKRIEDRLHAIRQWRWQAGHRDWSPANTWWMARERSGEPGGWGGVKP